MRNERTMYLAYMLRLWVVDSNNQPVWRASLESPDTGDRQAFRSLEDLFEFLEEKTVRPAQDAEDLTSA
jgi:hypothetical protein